MPVVPAKGNRRAGLTNDNNYRLIEIVDAAQGDTSRQACGAGVSRPLPSGGPGAHAPTRDHFSYSLRNAQPSDAGGHLRESEGADPFDFAGDGLQEPEDVSGHRPAARSKPDARLAARGCEYGRP